MGWPRKLSAGACSGGIAIISAGTTSIGTTGRSPGAGPESASTAFARLESMGLSTPVPTTRAGERLISFTDLTRGGASGGGTASLPIVRLTQPLMLKNRKSTSPQTWPLIFAMCPPWPSSPTSTSSSA